MKFLRAYLMNLISGDFINALRSYFNHATSSTWVKRAVSLRHSDFCNEKRG